VDERVRLLRGAVGLEPLDQRFGAVGLHRFEQIDLDFDRQGAGLQLIEVAVQRLARFR
jgi:hypothetical protein